MVVVKQELDWSLSEIVRKVAFKLLEDFVEFIVAGTGAIG